MVFEQVKLELNELARLGMITKAKLNKIINATSSEEVIEYEADGLSISDIADLLITIH